jgi:Sigma-70 region 2
VETFETYRPYLFAIASRLLGSAMDVEDLVQGTYLRSRATPPRRAFTRSKGSASPILSVQKAGLEMLTLYRDRQPRWLSGICISY